MAVFCRYIVFIWLGYLVKKSYICTKKSGNGSRLGQILEIMLFSKAIQIKLWVNKFNADRKVFDRKPIDFQCGMFSIGQWGVTLSAPDGGIFYSMESERLCTLVVDGDLTFWVGCNTFAPVLYFQ